MMVVLELLIYFFSLIPYITFFNFGTDLQPWAMLVAIAELIFFMVKSEGKLFLSRKQMLIYAICIVAIIVVCVFGENLYAGFRDSLAYITIICISLSSFFIFSYADGLNEKLVKVIIWIYFVVAFVQKYLYSDFLYFMIAGHRTTSNRGVPALTAEPSFYGYICVFLMFFVYDFKRGRLFYWAMLLVQIILLANSSVTLIYLGIITVSIVIVNIKTFEWKRIAQIFFASLGIVGVLYHFVQSNTGSRMTYLINQLFLHSNLSDGLYSFYKGDHSVFVRVNDIIECFDIFIKKLGIPQGSTRRISSGYGSLMVEMGIFGVILIYLFATVIYKGYYKNEGIVLAVSVTCMMFSAIQLATPVFSLFLGYCMFRSKKINQFSQ